MMNFRVIKNSLINKVLGPAENNRFQTVGFQRQAKGAAEAADFKRMVQVYFSTGDFSKSGGRLSGPNTHDITFRVDMMVSKMTAVDLTILDNQLATEAQYASAISQFQEASSLVDDSFDELAEVIYQILMDARNIDMGLDVGVVSGRWIGNIQKDKPLPRGEYVVLTGSIDLTCRTVEQVPGDIGLPLESIDTTIEIDTDNVGKSGVLVQI